MAHQQSTEANSIGKGVLGCAGGLILGLVGGGLLLMVLSFIMAATSSVRPPPAAASPGPDLRLTLSEDFLRRTIQDTTEDTVSLDILPGNQFKVDFDTEVTVLGTPLPLQVSGLFEVLLVGQAVEVRLLDTRVLGLNLPPELTDFFGDNLPSINQEVNRAMHEVSTALGARLILTDLATDGTRFWFEAREVSP